MQMLRWRRQPMAHRRVPARQVRVAATISVRWVGADVPVVEPPVRPAGNSCL